MRIAFYAPLKAPDHPVASGDRRVARLLCDALQVAGHTVEVVSDLRSFDGVGDMARQRQLAQQGREIAQALLRRWDDSAAAQRPQCWFTYHLYYKAPDWLGPAVVRALAIPYVVAEASHAPKRADGPWAFGHAAVEDALRQADLLLCPTAFDVQGLQRFLGQSSRIRRLPPFLDPQPYRRAARKRRLYRARLCQRLALPSSEPWLLVPAMMRQGDKLASYRVLAQALGHLGDLAWQLLVAGDGDARETVCALLQHAAPGRFRWLGQCDARGMAALYAAADLCVWPAVNEAYGMAMLEAQAAGLPVVSCATRGVPEVVQHGSTGLLAPAFEPAALAQCVRELLQSPARRHALGTAAAEFVLHERSLQQAGRTLAAALAPLGGQALPHAAPVAAP